MNGYLAPNGQFHKCDRYGHLSLAVQIADSLNLSYEKRLDAELVLQKEGWIIINDIGVYGLIGYPKDIDKEERLHLTKEQIQFLNTIYDKVYKDCQNDIDKLFERDK